MTEYETPLEADQLLNFEPIRDWARARVPHLSHLNTETVRNHLTNPEAYKQVIGETIDIPKWRKINGLLNAYTEQNGGFSFLQIGANDGVQGDPVHNHVIEDAWTGHSVEPVEVVYNKLVDNYKDVPGMTFIQRAIGDKDGTATMWVAKEKPDGKQNPIDALSSLDPTAIDKARQRIPDIDEQMEQVEVQVSTLPSLISEYNIEKIDGMFIDAEGYDAKILSLLRKIGVPYPQFIQYEHCLLEPEEKYNTEIMLRDIGYNLTHTRSDTFALLIARYFN